MPVIRYSPCYFVRDGKFPYFLHQLGGRSFGWVVETALVIIEPRFEWAFCEPDVAICLA